MERSQRPERHGERLSAGMYCARLGSECERVDRGAQRTEGVERWHKVLRLAGAGARGWLQVFHAVAAGSRKLTECEIRQDDTVSRRQREPRISVPSPPRHVDLLRHHSKENAHPSFIARATIRFVQK